MDKKEVEQITQELLAFHGKIDVRAEWLWLASKGAVTFEKRWENDVEVQKPAVRLDTYHIWEAKFKEYQKQKGRIEWAKKKQQEEYENMSAM